MKLISEMKEQVTIGRFSYNKKWLCHLQTALGCEFIGAMHLVFLAVYGR